MKISVALCTFNGEKYIAEQLESILSQKRSVEEIIVCDDCSTDLTYSILEAFQSRYPYIFKIFENETSLGITKNFEKAIQNCSGDLIFLSDQDDLWFPEKTKKIIDFFEKNPHFDAVFHNLQLYKDGEILPKTLWDTISFEENLRDSKKLLFHTILFDNVVTGAALAFRNTKNFHFENKNFLHDYYLALQFSSENKLGIINECLGFYRLHENQNVGTSTEKTSYQKKILKMQEIYYFHKNPAEKIKIISRGISKFEKSKNNFPFIPEKKLKLLHQELSDSIHEYLKTLSFTDRKKTLISWWKNKKYNITIFDILFR